MQPSAVEDVHPTVSVRLHRPYVQPGEALEGAVRVAVGSRGRTLLSLRACVLTRYLRDGQSVAVEASRETTLLGATAMAPRDVRIALIHVPLRADVPHSETGRLTFRLVLVATWEDGAEVFGGEDFFVLPSERERLSRARPSEKGHP